jgi:hypothetical protein
LRAAGDPAGLIFDVVEWLAWVNVVTSQVDAWEEKAVRAITATASSAAAGSWTGSAANHGIIVQRLQAIAFVPRVKRHAAASFAALVNESCVSQLPLL